MLALKDFSHLPQVDTLLTQLVNDRPGLILVAGLDARPGAESDGVLSSGRTPFFGILVREFLAAHRRIQTMLIADHRDAVRIPPTFRRQVHFTSVKPPPPLADQISDALLEQAQMLVLQQLDRADSTAAFRAALAGKYVLAQMDCVYCGADVTRHLRDLGVTDELLRALTWVITVQRFPKLCQNCKQPVELSPEQRAAIARYPDLGTTFCRAGGCDICDYTGRNGSVTAFDFYRAIDGTSPLTMQEYVLRLAAQGDLALDDWENLPAAQLQRVYTLLTASERASKDASAQLQQRLTELESANRVLQQRTESLISLQEIARTLITSTQLDELARQISRHAHKLCGADRSILYVLRADDTVEVLAVNGWDPSLVHTRLNAMHVLGSNPAMAQDPGTEPAPYRGYPPGIPSRLPDLEGAELRAGLRVPLVAQNEIVGLLIVHSTRKNHFAPGEIALVQTFAHQAAMAIQRAELIEQLKAKIVQLQAAQVELVKKERLERELELAREVQQALLPRTFPLVPGFEFAAKSETARRVGGDFYDVFQIDDAHFGMVIADVSDKGMPAALFMALTRSLLFAEAQRDLSPRQVLANVHRLLLALGEQDMFVTVFYGVVDTTERTLTYARAGHEKPLLLRDGSLRELSGKGTVLGSLDPNAFSLSEESVQLRRGDRIVLYTDGVTDALAPDEQPFGKERFEQLIRANADLSPADLCAATFAAVADYQGNAEQFDDMALLVALVQ